MQGDTIIPGVGLGEILGTGGFGVVRRGRHQALDVDVAVKITTRDLADPAAMEGALFEARLMARLDHPNLLRIHDAGRLGGSIYLVMEYMDGGTLEGMRRATPEALMDCTRQLLSGLQALHDARILHRDIKPANCLRRTRDARVKLGDLGISMAQVTHDEQSRSPVGTLPFMAPELFNGDPAFSARSDLYALGMTLACVALDEDPFPTGSMGQLLLWIGQGERPDLARARPDLPDALTRALARMMAPDPAHRPQSAAAALALLNDDRAARPASPTPTSPAPPTAPPRALRAGDLVVGPWLLGAVVHESTNWRGLAATHIHTGAAARLTFLREGGPLARSEALILGAAERAARLDHPGILGVLDWGRVPAGAYVVTAPSGRTLNDLIEAGGPLREVEALRCAAELADALAWLHARGLVYQIVEPGSALIGADARVAQLRWPIFCVPIGTPAIDAQGVNQRVWVSPWFAPEVTHQKAAIEPGADLYGLGEVLYFLLTGRAAFARPTGAQVLLAKGLGQIDLRALAPTVTGPTASLVAELLNPDPALRPDAAAARDALRRLADRLSPR